MQFAAIVDKRYFDAAQPGKHIGDMIRITYDQQAAYPVRIGPSLRLIGFLTDSLRGNVASVVDKLIAIRAMD